MWTRWTAPSDVDYAQQLEGRTRTGIERTCEGCGEPVMVRRSEVYQVHVFCETCVRGVEVGHRD
jgi:formylmethanofuran dehydrogenase subunit E